MFVVRSGFGPKFNVDAGAVGNAGTGGGAPNPADVGGTPAPAPSLPSVTETFTDIPQEFSSNPIFQGKQLKDVLTSYTELHHLQQARDTNGLVPLPGENSPPELINQFYEKLGKPKSAAEYDLTAPEDLPQGLDYSDERAAKFAEAAHGLNLTKSQTQGLFNFYHEMVKEEYGAYAQSQEQVLSDNLTKLEETWGGPQDSAKFKQNHQNAMRAFNAVADPELAAAFKADPMLASNPMVLTVLARLGAKMEPDSVPTVSSTVSTGQFTDSLSGINKAIKDFHESGKFKEMMNPGNAKAKELNQEWKNLYEKKRQLETGG